MCQDGGKSVEISCCPRWSTKWVNVQCRCARMRWAGVQLCTGRFIEVGTTSKTSYWSLCYSAPFSFTALSSVPFLSLSRWLYCVPIPMISLAHPFNWAVRSWWFYFVFDYSRVQGPDGSPCKHYCFPTFVMSARPLIRYWLTLHAVWFIRDTVKRDYVHLLNLEEFRLWASLSCLLFSWEFFIVCPLCGVATGVVWFSECFLDVTNWKAMYIFVSQLLSLTK